MRMAAYRVSPVRAGDYIVSFGLEGFSKPELHATVAPGTTVTVTATLEIQRLSETVQVLANTLALEADTSTQTTSFSNETLNELPTASRNYTHVIVAEAGVNAPLPDRTGAGLNIATNPGTQADDSSQSLNPSVNGARPTNNGLRINGVDATNMLNASGGLGNSITIPLDALEEVDVQTAGSSASRGRNGGGNIELITRSGSDRFSGSAGYYFQHEKMNANEFFLNRAGVAKPEFRRNDTTAHARRAASSRPHVFLWLSPAPGLPVRLRDQRERRDRPADRADRHAQRGDDCRRRQPVDPDRRAGRPALRAELHERAARLPRRSAGGPHRAVLRRPGAARVPPADSRRHSSRGAEHPEHEARRPVPDPVADRQPAAPQGQRHVRPGEPAAAGGPDGAGRLFRVWIHPAPDRQFEPDARHADTVGAGGRGGVRLGRRIALSHARTDARLAWRHLEHAQFRFAGTPRSQHRLLRPAEHAHREEPRHPQLDARHLQPARVPRSAASPR